MSTEIIDLQPGETDELPTIPHLVLYADLPFYSDPECTKLVTGASILVLQPLDPSDPIQELDVAPSCKKYKAGQIVQWDLNNKKLWETCWYKNPETGQVEKAWTFHVEFIGKVVNQKTVDANAEKLKELTASVQSRRNNERVN